MAVWLHSFLNSVLDEGEWSGFSPGHFTPEERDSRRQSGPQNRSRRFGEDKILLPCRHTDGSLLDRAAYRQVTTMTELSRLGRLN